MFLCAGACVCRRVHALRIVSMDKSLRFTSTLIIIVNFDDVTHVVSSRICYSWWFCVQWFTGRKRCILMVVVVKSQTQKWYKNKNKLITYTTTYNVSEHPTIWSIYSLALDTRIFQVDISDSPSVLIAFALQAYSLLSPSDRSDTKSRSLDFRLFSRSMWHEEKSERVKQLFLITCRVPSTELSDVRNMDSDNKSTSAFKSLPVHSTSCRLGNPLKSPTIRPEIKPHVDGLSCATFIATFGIRYEDGGWPVIAVSGMNCHT